MTSLASRPLRRRTLQALALLAATRAVRSEPAGAAFPAEVAAALQAGHLLVEPGSLPLLLCAAHDGERELPGIAARVRGVRVRDQHTLALSESTARHLEQLSSARPWRIVCRVTRQQVDVNRPEEDAFEHPDARPVWLGYHRAIEHAVAALRAAYPGGALLLDLHGQGYSSNRMYRGTRNGRTVSALVARAGREALDGPHSLIGQLAARGLQVAPAPGTDAREEQRYVGGHTVATYGSHRPGGVDAIQLEFGTRQRALPSLGETLAAATLAFLRATPGFADGLPAAAREDQRERRAADAASKASSHRLRSTPAA